MARLDALLLCDSAARDAQTGKWTLSGVFDAVWAAQFPAIHASLDVYFRLRTAGSPPVELRCRTPSDSVAVLAAVTVTPSPRGLVEGVVRVVRLEFAVPGEYRFELYADGAMVGETGLTVAQLPTPASPLH